MVLAGVVAHADGWAVGLPITIGGGLLILAAFEAAKRASPHRPPGVATLPRPLALAATLASGGIMVLAGYGATAWDWWLALILVPIGGLVIMAAFALELDGAEQRT
jgi:hypothetical protein